MNSYLTDDFVDCYYRLPARVRERARKNYQLWRQNPNHPSLQFKRIHSTEPLYSVRIGLGWRALGLRDGEDFYWFWIGSHSDYDKLLSQF